MKMSVKKVARIVAEGQSVGGEVASARHGITRRAFAACMRRWAIEDAVQRAVEVILEPRREAARLRARGSEQKQGRLEAEAKRLAADRGRRRAKFAAAAARRRRAEERAEEMAAKQEEMAAEKRRIARAQRKAAAHLLPTSVGIASYFSVLDRGSCTF